MKTDSYKSFPQYSNLEYSEYVYEPEFSRFRFNKMPGLFIDDSDYRLPSKPAYGSCRFLPKTSPSLYKFSWRTPDSIFLIEKWEPSTNIYSYNFVTWPDGSHEYITDIDKVEAAERLYKKLAQIKSSMRECVQYMG